MIWTSKHYVKKSGKSTYCVSPLTWNFQKDKYGETESAFVVSWQVLGTKDGWILPYVSCASVELQKIGDVYYKGNLIINKETWFDHQELDTGFLPCSLLDIYFLDILLDILKAAKAQELVPKLSLGTVAKTLCEALIKC